MKIKQLFTSFLACMALWSVPVYAKKTISGYDVKKAYDDAHNAEVNAEKHGDSEDYERYARYALRYNTFNKKYAEFLKDLDQALQKNHSKRAKKKMQGLVSDGTIDSDERSKYMNEIGLDNAALEPLKKVVAKNKKSAMETMNKLYEKMKKKSDEINKKAQQLYNQAQQLYNQHILIPQNPSMPKLDQIPIHMTRE